jgi:DNA-directed RNA polymerase specialized sigma24 family protein
MTPAAATIDPFALQQAGIRASQLVASFGFHRADWDDLRQDLLLDYLKRSRHYQSGRGEHRGFIFGVVRNRAARLAIQNGRRPTFISGVDDRVLMRNSCACLAEPSAPIEMQMDVRKVVASLPEHLREVAVLLSRMSVAEVRRETGKSRPRIYQMIGEIRQAFQEAGLAPSGGAR